MALTDSLIETLKSTFATKADIADATNEAGILRVGADEQYETIQAAVDTIPSDDHSSYNEGATIVVMPSYDSGAESFPVVVDRKQVTIEGYEPSSARVVVPKDADVPAFKIIGVGSTDYRNTWQLRDLRITNGSPAVQMSNSVQARIENVTFRHPQGDAIRFVPGPGGEVSYSNKINRCRVLWGTGNGITLANGAACHATTINQCTINNVDGVGVVLNGSSNTIRDSEIQKSGEEAILIESGNNPRVRDSYFEKNGRLRAARDTGDFPMDIDIHVCQNVAVTGNYFYAFGTSRRALNMRAADTAEVRNNRYREYSSTDGRFIAIHGESKDIDIHKASHRGDHDDLRNFEAFDRGVRTRDNGVVRMQDLSEVSGRYPGDRGIDDGSNAPTGQPTLAVWHDGKWHYGLSR